MARLEADEPERIGPSDFDVQLTVRVIIEDGDSLADVIPFAIAYLKMHQPDFNSAPQFMQSYMAEALARYALAQHERSTEHGT